jgi:peptide/nickel transport system permease protein
MRITDSLLSLPQMPVLILFAAVDLTKLPFLGWLISQQNESVAKLVVVLCLFSWMTVARLVRGSVLSLREREYILASQTLGATDRTLILTHMLPNVMAPLLVTVTVNVGQSILFEAALSFLGLGVQPPTPSWGNMLSNAQELVSAAPLLVVIPGLLILLTVISFNFVGDGLQEAINPKSVKR